MRCCRGAYGVEARYVNGRPLRDDELMRGLFASRGLRFNCEGGAYGTAEQEEIVGAHVEVLRAGGADVGTDPFGGVGRDGRPLMVRTSSPT